MLVTGGALFVCPIALRKLFWQTQSSCIRAENKIYVPFYQESSLQLSKLRAPAMPVGALTCLQLYEVLDLI